MAGRMESSLGDMPPGDPVVTRTPAGFKSVPVAVSHLLFKTVAILIYLLFGDVSKDFVWTFIMIILLLSLDFWTVKNVTGRLMVGLRWWNEISSDGVSTWKFESKKDQSTVREADSYAFWGGLYICFVLWCLFALMALFQLKSLMICIVAVMINSANVIGYTKCRGDLRKKLSENAGGFLARNIGSIGSFMGQAASGAMKGTSTPGSVSV